MVLEVVIAQGQPLLSALSLWRRLPGLSESREGSWVCPRACCRVRKEELPTFPISEKQLIPEKILLRKEDPEWILSSKRIFFSPRGSMPCG
jgi:hypothetical protein